MKDKIYGTIVSSTSGEETIYTVFQVDARRNISHLFRPELLNAEQSAGFELSQVFAKKESSAQLSWSVDTKEIINDQYPDVEDGFDPEKMKSLND